MKKAKILFTLFLLITLVTTISSAAYADVTMSVVEEPTATINYGTNSIVERSIISKDLDNKEITLQLKVTNNEQVSKPTGEVMLVIDNSKSMLEKVDSTNSREDLVISSAKTLITNLLKDNTKLKIGVVSFSTNSDVSKEGTVEDATLVSDLSNDANALTTAISNIEYTGPRTDLQAGINLAKQKFTDDTDKAHKYMIVLSDGVPNVALNYDKNYYSDDVITKTKTELQSLSSLADNVYIMLTGITQGNAVATPSTKTYNQIIESIFGTETQPTVGKFYYIDDTKISDTINNIYKALLPVSKTFTKINVKDYFTDEIVKNFNFSIVEKPNFGTITDKIDTTTNSITWTIPELKSGKTAIVQYKLKLKTNYDSNIVNKVLNTNSKLDVTYTDSDNKTDTKSTDITPKVKLTENLPTVLPKAGSTIFFSFMGIVLVIAVAFGIKYVLVKNSMK